MRVERRELDRIATVDWDRLAGGSFFSSRAFLELWRAKHGRPVAWVVEDAGRLAAMIPGVEYGRGPFARFVSLPDGCYGGVRIDAERGIERARLSRCLLDGVVAHRYAKTCVFDFYGSVEPHPAYRVSRAQTLLVDLTDPDWSPADPKLRSQIRKAAREGIRVEPFVWERHHAGFLALVEKSARHHGQPVRYPVSLYHQLAQIAERDDRVQWIHCEHDGRPAASHIYFVEGHALQAWQSHFDRAFSFLKPNQYIRLATCRASARRGIRWLNLGSTPATASGLAYYKARWGGRPIRYATWTRWEGLGAIANAWNERGARHATVAGVTNVEPRPSAIGGVS